MKKAKRAIWIDWFADRGGFFFICTVLFEIFKQPVYIIVIIPISFNPLILIFHCFDFYFDRVGYAAICDAGRLGVMRVLSSWSE